MLNNIIIITDPTKVDPILYLILCLDVSYNGVVKDNIVNNIHLPSGSLKYSIKNNPIVIVIAIRIP